MAARPELPIPILALDVADGGEMRHLLKRVPDVRWVKFGLQLFTAGGPSLVRGLVDDGYHVFLDLKLHDIPTTVARAVESASGLGVKLLTLHASGGRAMLVAAREAAASTSEGGTELLAVTLLTSLSDAEVREAWGRQSLAIGTEAQRLALLARECGIDGVVASVHEARLIREVAGQSFRILTPGIRLEGDRNDDQTRVSTPEQAARAGADYLVLGRAVTASPDPASAWDRVLEGIIRGAAE